MNHKLMLAVCLGALTPAGAARADVVTDRVVLVPGASGCPAGSTGMKRLKQSPDGAQVQETTEFQVPAGTYLEITSVEYTTPYYMQWAKFYVQSIYLNIRQRYGQQSTNVFSASFSTGAMYDEDENYNFNGFGQYASQGAYSNVATFPVGPLMSNAGRLCFTAKNEFWTYGGAFRVRGRLIASGEPVVLPPPGGGVLSP